LSKTTIAVPGNEAETMLPRLYAYDYLMSDFTRNQYPKRYMATHTARQAALKGGPK
jgi:hypothetical protein